MLNCKIILNPTSGQGVGGSLKTRILSLLNLKEDDIAITQSLQHASELAKDFAIKGVNPVVACGGDGILNAVVNGVLEISRSVKIGFIPAGMSNVCANCVGIPQDFEKAIFVLKKGFSKKIDAGLFEDKRRKIYFISMADFGITAEIVRKAEKDHNIKRIFGKGAHVFLGAFEFLKKKKNFRVLVEDKFFNVPLAIFSNGKYWGGALFWDKSIKIDDGEGNLFIFEKLNFFKALKIFSELIRHKNPKVKQFKTKEFSIEGEKIPFQLDGEFYGFTDRARIQIIPSCFPIIAQETK